MNRWLLRTLLLSSFIVASFGAFWLLTRSERLATFKVGTYTINVYAEPEFLYEPPGFIYFNIRQCGITRMQERRFMRIGSERKPLEKFTLIMTSDSEVVALVLDNEIQMIHEFSSGYTWPGPYTNVTEPQMEMAELLLQRLLSENPGIHCSRQLSYRDERDRLRNQKSEATGSPQISTK